MQGARWSFAAGALLVGACDVVFRLDDVSGGQQDARPIDAPVDASLDVVAHYRFEENMSITDEVGRHDGTPVGPITLVQGQVGMAIEIAGVNTYATVPDSADFDLMTGAIELWVRPAPGIGTFGIMSRDSSGPSAGHFMLAQLDQNAFVARFQRATDGNGAAGLFLCSTAPIMQRWTHLVINLGDPPEMWVDGVQQLGTQTISLFGGTFTCGANEPRGISGNDEPWVFGALGVASSQGTTDNVSSPYTGGALDELRILRGRVTF